MPKISVIMPVYNTKKEYLKEAIDSILNQTYSDFEFIIVDDGSTLNDVKETIISYKDDRIKYFYKENGGIAKALNFALDKASGDYIARMDSDDISYPDRFEKQLKYFKEHPDISLVSTWIETFPIEKNWGHHKENIKFLDVYEGWCINHPTVMWKRADFEKYNLRYPENGIACEDYVLWSNAIRFLKIANIQEALLKYRYGEENTSVIKEQKIAQGVETVRQSMLDILTDDENIKNGIRNLIFPPPPIQKTKVKLLEQIFSVKNENNKKVIRILGIKISFRRKNKMRIKFIQKLIDKMRGKNKKKTTYFEKSYSQGGEDVLIYNFTIRKPNYKGFYVDIGAHHPLRYSNTQLFYENGWKGINIDATPGSMDEFKKLRKKDVNLEVGISDKEGELTYYCFEEPALNGFESEAQKKRVKDGLKLKEKIKVKTKTINQILDEYVPEGQCIDFVNIDVEGIELDILKTYNYEKYAPEFFLIEELDYYGYDFQQKAKGEIGLLLKEKGYIVVGKTNMTVIYRKFPDKSKEI